MMEYLKSWAVTFCICSFVVLIIKILCPKGNMEKSLNIVLSLFMISALIFPLSEKRNAPVINFDKIENEISDSQGMSAEYSEAALKTQLRALTNEALNELGFNDFELNIELDTDSSGNIVLEKYEIQIPSGLDKEKIKNGIKEKVGTEPTISELP